MTESHAWNDRLEVADEAMNHEHHLQIALVSGFVDALEQGRPALAHRLAAQLHRYSDAHFAGEELLMEASGDPEREAHAAAHAAFLRRIRELEAAPVDDAALAAALELREALAAHIHDLDRALAVRTSPRNEAAAGTP